MQFNSLPQWASTVSALVSALALIFTSTTLRRSTKNNDLNALIKMNESFTKSVNDFIDAPSADKKEQRFCDLLNILEVYAASLNARLLPSKARNFAENLLMETIYTIENDNFWRSQYESVKHEKNAMAEMEKLKFHMSTRIYSSEKNWIEFNFVLIINGIFIFSALLIAVLIAGIA